MYLNVAGPGRSMGRISGNGDDKSKYPPIKIEGSEPVMAALPYMGVSAAFLTGTFLLPKEEQWAKVTRLVLAAAGAGSAIVGVVAALKTKKALQPKGPLSEAVPPKDEEVPKVGAGRLEEMLKIDLDPQQPRTGGSWRNLWSDQYYEATVKNDSNQTLTFYPGIALFNDEGKLVHRTPMLQRKSVTLEPRASKQMGTPDLAKLAKRPDEEPIFLIPSGVVAFTPQTYLVEVELYRTRDDGEAFMRTGNIPIKYAWVG